MEESSSTAVEKEVSMVKEPRSPKSEMDDEDDDLLEDEDLDLAQEREMGRGGGRGRGGRGRGAGDGGKGKERSCKLGVATKAVTRPLYGERCLLRSCRRCPRSASTKPRTSRTEVGATSVLRPLLESGHTCRRMGPVLGPSVDGRLALAAASSRQLDERIRHRLVHARGQRAQVWGLCWGPAEEPTELCGNIELRVLPQHLHQPGPVNLKVGLRHNKPERAGRGAERCEQPRIEVGDDPDVLSPNVARNQRHLGGAGIREAQVHLG